jgi:hypothetical protein
LFALAFLFSGPGATSFARPLAALGLLGRLLNLRICSNPQSVTMFALMIIAIVATAEAKKGPKITNKVFFDIEIGGEKAGRITMVRNIDMIKRIDQ